MKSRSRSIPTRQVTGSLDAFLLDYRKRRKPIDVSFRELVRIDSYPEYATHLVHPYPAKLLAHIPYFFLASKRLIGANGLLLDPFCGSGTVLLEGVLAGCKVVGADVNPLARLIARVKIAPIDLKELVRQTQRVDQTFRRRRHAPAVDRLTDRLGYWFYPRTLRALEAIRITIAEIDDAAVRDFLLVAFSVTLRRLSRADPRLSVPVRLRKDQYPATHWLRANTEARLKCLARAEPLIEFLAVVDANRRRAISLASLAPRKLRKTIIQCDGRALYQDTETVDLVITSPPYSAAQKYIRASSMGIEVAGPWTRRWTGLAAL